MSREKITLTHVEALDKVLEDAGLDAKDLERALRSPRVAEIVTSIRRVSRAGPRRVERERLGRAAQLPPGWHVDPGFEVIEGIFAGCQIKYSDEIGVDEDNKRYWIDSITLLILDHPRVKRIRLSPHDVTFPCGLLSAADPDDDFGISRGARIQAIVDVRELGGFMWTKVKGHRALRDEEKPAALKIWDAEGALVVYKKF